MNKKGPVIILLLIGVLAVLALFFVWKYGGLIKLPAVTQSSQEKLPAGWEKGAVKRAVDGDTVELSDGRKVRYIGMNTPETVHPSKPVECFGKEASNKNKELVDKKEVYLEKDAEDKDIYDRILRYVYIKNQDSLIMVNEYLVRNGYANVYTFPPNVKYTDRFIEAERLAREERVGLWNKCR